jgi:hypothetical protein
MNVTRSAALLLAATLVIGMVLGVLGAGALRPRFERAGPPWMGAPNPGVRGRPGGFTEHMEEVIAPRDSAQRVVVRGVIDRTAARNRSLIEQLNRTLRASVDSMRGELAPLLSEDQRQRLERAVVRLPAVRGPGGPGPRGPPGDGSPRDGGPPPP